MWTTTVCARRRRMNGCCGGALPTARALPCALPLSVRDGTKGDHSAWFHAVTEGDCGLGGENGAGASETCG